jgi:hypothetical protein
LVLWHQREWAYAVKIKNAGFSIRIRTIAVLSANNND